MHDGGAPGPLRELLGVEVDEHWPVPDGRAERVELAGRVGAQRRIETSGEGLDTRCALLDRRYANPVWGEWLDARTAPTSSGGT